MFIIKSLMNGAIICLAGMGWWNVQAWVLATFGYEWPTWQRVLVTLGVCVLVAIYLQFSSSKIIIRERK